jgi:hypothetical protein
MGEVVVHDVDFRSLDARVGGYKRSTLYSGQNPEKWDSQGQMIWGVPCLSQYRTLIARTYLRQ